MAEEPERTEFLPPQAPGPEPELGPAPESPEGAWQPPQHAQAPPQGQPPPEQTWQQPPQQGWQQPPPGWGYTPQPAQPAQSDNSPAVAGFVLSIVALALLLLTGGLSSVISLGCAIPGMIYSHRGRRKISSGETTKNEGLAKAGWIIGIVSTVLAVLATIGWTVALLDEDFRDDLEREFDNSQSIRAMLQITAAVGRTLLG